MRIVIIASALLLAQCGHPEIARAGEDKWPPPRCALIETAKANMLARPGGSWVEVTHDQRLFLVGLFVASPNTRAGIPLGDTAAIARFDALPGAFVYFEDGPLACDPLFIPPPIVDMLSLDIEHESPMF
jgi:hypothetical protein